MKVTCSVEECDVEDEDPQTGVKRDVEGVCITCSRCNQETVAFGTGEKSIKRALASLRDDCPNNEENFYVAEETGGESKMPDPIVKPWWKKNK